MDVPPRWIHNQKASVLIKKISWTR